MASGDTRNGADEMLSDYDFSKGVRDTHAKRYAEGTSVTLLNPDFETREAFSPPLESSPRLFSYNGNMPSLTETLRTLHRIHRQHSDLKDRLSRGPRQIQAAEMAVKKCETDLGQAKDAYKQAKMASDEKQLQLKHRESKLADLQAKLNMAQSNKEYQLLKDQMAADKQANSVLADEILETLEKIDQLQAAVKTADSNLAKTKDELSKVGRRISDQQHGLESELARVRGALDAAEGQLDGDFKDN